MRLISTLLKRNLPSLVASVRQISNLKRVTTLQKVREMALPISRPDPFIMKLDNAEFQSLFTDDLRQLDSLFKQYNYELRIAGGAVRDLLMGKRPKDVDFATTATPQQMKQMFIESHVRMINPKGEIHGTITSRIGQSNFEITTLRVDLVTDGRHAKVEFTTDWLLDANRRDLTINSMYLGLDGCVYDYFYGHDDLKKRRIAFVGDAARRIQEDYLRILRYFRFYGRIAKEPNAHEGTILKTIQQNGDGLQRISGERIWMELKQILEGNFAGHLLQMILHCRLGPYIGLPEEPNVDELKAVLQRNAKKPPNYLHAMTLLSTLFRTEEEALAFHGRLKLSGFERDLALFVIRNRDLKPNTTHPLLPFQKLTIGSKIKLSDTRLYVEQIIKYNDFPFFQEFRDWVVPRFPITGTDLLNLGVKPGKPMGRVLDELKLQWAESNFTLTNEELRQSVAGVVAEQYTTLK